MRIVRREGISRLVRVRPFASLRVTYERIFALVCHSEPFAFAQGKLREESHKHWQALSKRLLVNLATIAVLASWGARPAVADIVLIERGQARVSIVTPDQPSFLERKAAQELQQYLGRIGGAQVQIAAEAEANPPRILVGRTAAGLSIVPQAEAEKLGAEGFVIRTRGVDIAVVGGGDYGTLYGCYELLEKYLGVRWYLPDPLGEIVPRRERVVLPAIDDKQKPAFAMRWVGNVDEWNLRNKQNRVTSRDYPPAFRVQPAIYHSQARLLPRARYFAKHPEYFALVRGKRSDNPNAKLCYSNPELPRVIAENLAELRRQEPPGTLVSFTPTDEQVWCECDQCRAMDDAGGVAPDEEHSRRSLIFYNRIAEQFARLCPGEHLLVGAYNVYNAPPRDKNIRARDNLSLIITHYNAYCMFHPVIVPNCPLNQRYRQVVEGWKKLIPDIYFYEYYYKAAWLDLPWPIVHCIAADIPFYESIGVKGLYTQYNAGSVWTNVLNYYVAAKLLWNPHADVRAMLDEFYRNFYGAAARPMKGYHEALERATANVRQHNAGDAIGYAKYIFTEDVLRELGRLLDQARRLAADDAARARIEKVAISYKYTTRLVNCVGLADPERLSRIPDREHLEREIARARREIEALCADIQAHPELYDGVVGRTLLRRERGEGLSEALSVYDLPGRRQAAELGLAGDWMLIGPFDNENMTGHDRPYPPENTLDMKATYQGKTGPVRWWKHANPAWDGYIDLARLMKPSDWTCAYALCYVTAPRETKAQLRAGSNDSLIVWLGGRKVLDRKVERAATMDDDIVEVTIPAGTTPILLKVCQTKGNWGFYFRITDASGQPLRGVRFSAQPGAR